MPSLRKRVSSYFRQLSFHNEPREKRHNINENAFVTKYLQGQIPLKEGPQIIYGKNPTDLPNYELGKYDSGPDTLVGCYSGPNGGLTTVKRTEKHLSMLDADIDFIDTPDEVEVPQTSPKKSPQRKKGQPIDNTKMVIKVAGNEYCVTNRPKKSHNKSHSLGSLSDFKVEIEKTKIDKEFYASNNNCDKFECKNQKESQHCDKTNESDVGETKKVTDSAEDNCKESKVNRESVNRKNVVKTKRQLSTESTKNQNQRPLHTSVHKERKPDGCDKKINQNYGLTKSKSEGNPFGNKKRGKIIKIAQRPNAQAETTEESNIPSVVINDSSLPEEWNRKSELVYGLSDSLYDRNQVTKNKNGDPIADCFGIISRNDSAILAVADGVNWGEKASIAAKSAVHGCLHYLDKTIFNDTKPFENLTIKTDESAPNSLLNIETRAENPIKNTREVFVCLLRAFSCAHDLILENKGMLTTLTVAVVLPLKQKAVKRSESQPNQEVYETRYICCVCNVGDTLAYVYSQKYGVRELTKGSHDINCNRDMRDALGALGPVDGINPELSNLTLSITTLQKGDIVMVASDGLTDNFDPNVCKFAVNTPTQEPAKPKRASTNKPPRTNLPNTQIVEQKPKVEPQPLPPAQTDNFPKPPIKPPRRSKNRDDISRGSVERASIKSNSLSSRSTSTVDSSSNVPTNNSNRHTHQGTSSKPLETHFDSQTDSSSKVEYENPLVAQFMLENSVTEKSSSQSHSRTSSLDSKKPLVIENKASSLRKQTANQVKNSNRSKNADKLKTETAGYKFLRSKTSVDFRSSNSKQILRNSDGIPFVTPLQRYELQLLLIEDILKNGISGRDSPCTTAKKLCENLISFTLSITSAKRHTLEDQDLYFDNRNGVLVEVSNQEKKIRRKKGLEKVQNLPGKLDHVTIVAYNVGNSQCS